MPFTPTHLLAAIPIAKVWWGPVPIAALAIGTMAPDWPLFFAWGPTYAETHALSGLLTQVLPLALLLFVTWHVICREPLFQLLPERVRHRAAHLLKRPRLRDWRFWVAALLALYLGALTHVVWDAFTHRGQWGVTLLPLLRDELFSVGEVSLAGYKVLQHGSSFIGLPVLAAWLYFQYKKAQPGTAPWSPLSTAHRIGVTTIVFALSIAAGLAAGVNQWSSAADWDSARAAVFAYITSGGRLFLAMTFGYCVAYQCWRLLARSKR